jgi:hypothetical protein
MAQQGYSWVKNFLTLYVAESGTLVVESTDTYLGATGIFLAWGMSYLCTLFQTNLQIIWP